MAKYATQTSVSVEKSRAEIEAVLSRYGASHFGYMCGPAEAQIQFATKSRSVRFSLPLPDKSENQFWFTPARRQRVDSDRAHANWEQACRQRWRALLLAIKAKLESVECGISTFEQEFMAFIVNPSTGRTIGEEITPLIEERYQNPESRRPLGLPAPSSNGEQADEQEQA